MGEQPSSTNWRQVEPEHVAEIDAATDNVIAALTRLGVATGDTLIEAAATGYVISRLDEWLERECEGELSSDEVDDDLG